MSRRLLVLGVALFVGVMFVVPSAIAHEGRKVATEAGASVTISACGNATVAGNNTAGRITFTTGATTCQVNFTETLSTAPSCAAFNETAPGAGRASAFVTRANASTSRLVIDLESEPGDTDTLVYICIGR